MEGAELLRQFLAHTPAIWAAFFFTISTLAFGFYFGATSKFIFGDYRTRLKILEKDVEIRVKNAEDSLQSKEDDKFIGQLYDVFGKIRREKGLGIP